MKKLFIICLAVVMTVVFGFTTVNAEPSAKATAQIGDLGVVDVSKSGGSGVTGEGNTGWRTLFTQDIKTPTGKDLFINVSLECGLTTDTTVMSKKLARAVAEAEAVVEVRVVVDSVPVPVNGNEPADTDITFARRNQQLIAEFAGDISGCMTIVVNDNDTPDDFTDDYDEIVIDWACVSPEMLQLILDTMQANSFNFIVPDLFAGTHTVQIQAKLSYLATGNLVQETIDAELLTLAWGSAAARAYLGNGSVTIETVRMIKDEDVIVDLD
ncbi:hypothetical protein [Desulfobacula sp.]|uniref:hypothetical protein n=1 Tax=Desulfobacula sp. TaxID=2593537 RepID=UPI0025C07044|nr:hypothetical protein [Desulfobacula sp.]MBC2704567.1 hypothetical protein [Desulfobacula sp.]